MAGKIQLISELAGWTARDVTRDAGSWKRYLDTASRLYKYRFDDQLLIYAQRPDATACAGMELWNDEMRRWVKADSRGIALIRERGNGRPYLKYVFDVSDTRPMRGARMPYLWEMREEHYSAVLTALQSRYGETESQEPDTCLMEIVAGIAAKAYHEYLRDMAYDTEGNGLRGPDVPGMEERFRKTLTASVRYAVFARCGLDAGRYPDDDGLSGITDFSTPAVLHHLGDAVSTLSMEILQEIGRVIRKYDREMMKNPQKNSGKPLEKSAVPVYTEEKEEFNTLKRESNERSTDNGRTDLHEERGLPDTGSEDGRGRRSGGDAVGEIRAAAAEFSEGTSPRDVHVHAADGEAHAASVPDRPAGTGAGRPGGSGDDGTKRRGREDEGARPDGMALGSEPLHGTGGGNGTKGDRLQVNREGTEGQEEQENRVEEQTAGREPAVSVRHARPVSEVPESVIARALTNGGNGRNSILHIITFFGKSPSMSDAAVFLQKEYGTGGRGLTIAGKDYALWYTEEGIRIAPGHTTNVDGCTLVPWGRAAALTLQLLKDGVYATREKLDEAWPNECRELAAGLWRLRQDLTEEAAGMGFLPRVSALFGGFPKSTERIGEFLKEKDSRDAIVEELDGFNLAYKDDPGLLRFRKLHNPEALLDRIADLDLPREQFPATEGFEPEKGSFITEDEIDSLMTRGSGVFEGKMRICSYFMQGHDERECVSFLQKEYGNGGSMRTGYSEWHNPKGIRFTRQDEYSGNEGYDTVNLNWNQVQKRLRGLIDAGKYLNREEQSGIPKYEKTVLARKIYMFYSYSPAQKKPVSLSGRDVDAGVYAIMPRLSTPGRSAALYRDMAETFARMPQEERGYRAMQEAVEDMAAFLRGEYSLFTPLPEETLREQRMERETPEAAKQEVKSTPETEREPVGELEAAARSLAKKIRREVKEQPDGQLSFDFAAADMEDAKPSVPEKNGKPEGQEEPETETARPETDEELPETADNADMEEAKRLVEEFCLHEYGEGVDFDNPEHLEIAATDTEDGQHEIQAEVNLLDYSMNQFLDGVCVDKRSYGSLRELIDAELSFLDFDALVRLEAPPELSKMVEAEGRQIVTADPVKVYSNTGLPYDIAVQKLHTGPDRRNFRITDDNLGTGGQKTKYRNNITAIRTLKQIEAKKRPATPEEQEVLSHYVGWGGLAQAFDAGNEKWAKEYAELKELLTPEEYESARGTVLNAHYTSPVVIKAMYEAVSAMDFVPGNILEPSCGTGNFFGLIPEKLEGANLYGVELDSVTGRIARQLYQKADIVVDGFENTGYPDDFFDLAVGNVPFGEYKVHDRRYDRQNLLIHDYFLVKALDKVRPGGVAAFITTKGTMDKANCRVREALAQKAELLGAVRLPNTAFLANAGTEVTSDILFFQKRGSAPEKLPDWVNIGETEDGVPLNNYFLQHPEMVLGKMSFWKNMYGSKTDTACLPIEGADLSLRVSEAVRTVRPPDRELLYMDAPGQAGGEKEETIPADPQVRNFSFTEKEGKLYFRENSRMKHMEPGKMSAARIRGMIGIRDSARKLIDLQLSGVDDEVLGKEQARLGTLYDSFREKYGLLNSAGNRLAFRQDSSYPLLCSLEVLDEEGNFKRKADMFTKRTIQHRQPAASVDTAVEALGVSIGERACVDLGYMASLMGGSDRIPQIVSDLKGIIFKDPATGPFDMEAEENWYRGWQTADEYLSGNVRQKLITAGEAAKEHPEFDVNVQALKQVQPKDLTAPEISVRIGAPWIDTEYYQQFLFELLQTPRKLQGDKICVMYSDVSGEWRLKGKHADSTTNARVWNTYGTKRMNAYEIFEACLNQRSVQIFDTHTDEAGRETRVLNERETAVAQQKQETVKEAFGDWIWKDPDRRTDLCATYNRLFNSTRPREYDGQHLIFTGMNPEIRLEPHQRNAVARILYGGNTLLAHVVGAGKTFEMVAAAMESRRLGLCRKSMIVVPNHLTEQWGGDFLTLYPGAKVLVATKRDFEPKNRKKFCARIATGDYDAVIIGHSQFERIPISPARQEAVIQGQIDEIMDAIAEAKANKEETFTIKQMEKTKKNLEAKIQKLYDRKKDDTVYFEELGIDRLFVDEAHAFKNLYMHTKMRNVAGISQTDAQKSSDMFAKCRYMDELTGGRGIVFATGTPVSNSMVELYTMMRYLQYGMLEQGFRDSTGKIRSLKHFDNWAATFGEQVTAVELKPEGTGFRLKTRFARFYNLPELMNRWKEAADIQTAEMLKLPVPEAEYITIQTEPSEAQKLMVKDLADRAEKIRKEKTDPSVDNMLKITSDGRKLALDQRIMNPLLPDDPGSKVNACVQNVFQIWQESAPVKGTQLIFSDLSTPKGRAETGREDTKGDAAGTESPAGGEAVEASADETVMEASIYEDIRKKLIAKGIPAEQIAFVHSAHTETQKAELFAKVRSGQVRVLLGSTQKMGAGTNVQTKLVALHDLDCPWRPADLEQRGGRIVRRGNENSHVRIFRYVTKGTFDAYTWGLVESKQKFIGQIMTGKSPARSIEDVDATALTYAEVKMLATGDVRIKEKMDLDIQVTKLKVLKSSHLSQQYEMQDKVRGYFPNKIKEAGLYIECLEKELPMLAAHPVKDDDFSMTVMGNVYTERKEAGRAIVAACRLMDDPGKEIALGEYRGFPMRLAFDGAKFKVTMKQYLTHTAELSDDVSGNITRINNALEKIPQSLEAHKANLERLQKEFESAKEEADRPFPKEAELAEKSARLAELNVVLDSTEKSAEKERSAEPEQEGQENVKDEPPHGQEGKTVSSDAKPSILQEIKKYQPPATVQSGAARGRDREVVLCGRMRGAR